jgi:hypothetical protein
MSGQVTLIAALWFYFSETATAQTTGGIAAIDGKTANLKEEFKR